MTPFDIPINLWLGTMNVARPHLAAPRQGMKNPGIGQPSRRALPGLRWSYAAPASPTREPLGVTPTTRCSVSDRLASQSDFLFTPRCHPFPIFPYPPYLPASFLPGNTPLSCEELSAFRKTWRSLSLPRVTAASPFLGLFDGSGGGVGFGLLELVVIAEGGGEVALDVVFEAGNGDHIEAAAGF